MAQYYCDELRHLVCYTYSVENLHEMASVLGIKRCWYHPSHHGKHYDIPTKRIDEIKSHPLVKVVSWRVIMHIIKGGEPPSPKTT